MPYLGFMKREILFRELVIMGIESFAGKAGDGTTEETVKTTPLEDKYCENCKKAGLADCSTCSKEFSHGG